MNADWDDLRVILAVGRGGSARRAGNSLGMSHATVSRRIDSFEVRHGVKIFDRLPSGYTTTQEGEDLLRAAAAIESEVHTALLKLTGKDSRLSGVIRITTLDPLATHFLIPILHEFSQLYPEIEFELMVGYESLDLRKREADIAIRAVVGSPPEHLIGHKLASVAWTGYASPEYVESQKANPTDQARWIGWGTRSADAPWVKRSPIPEIPAWGCFDDIFLQIEAARNHMGIAYIPCYVGDPSSDLIRVPNATLVFRHDLWLLRHKDTRRTARLRLFSQYLSSAFVEAAALFRGASAK